MHILVIPSWYPTGEDKLMGIYHKQFCRALSKQENMKVNMLFIDRQRLSKPFDYIKMDKHFTESEDGYTVYLHRQLNISPISFDLQQKSYTHTLFNAYKKYISIHGKPDIIHAQVIVPAGAAAAALGEAEGIPVVITEHSSYFERFFTGKEKKYAEFASKRCALTSVSGYMANSLKKITKKNVDVLPNVVDDSFLNIKRAKRQDCENRLLSVCALREGKNIGLIASAMKILIDGHRLHRLSLTVIGDGFYENKYKDEVRSIGMDKYVTFVGRKNKEQIGKYMSESDALVVASDIETFCIPAVEALFAGLPVISTRCGGPQEFISSDCGVLCETNDASGMADAIEDLFRRKDSFIPEKLRESSLKFSEQGVAKCSIGIYRKILEAAN